MDNLYMDNIKVVLTGVISIEDLGMEILFKTGHCKA